MPAPLSSRTSKIRSVRKLCLISHLIPCPKVEVPEPEASPDGTYQNETQSTGVGGKNRRIGGATTTVSPSTRRYCPVYFRTSVYSSYTCARWCGYYGYPYYYWYPYRYLARLIYHMQDTYNVILGVTAAATRDTHYA